MKISGVNPSRLDFKPLGKLIFRLVKTFNLPTSICPNLIKKREKGVLNFLLKKKYVEKTLGNESWEEMVLEVVGADENLQLDLVKGAVLFGDMKEALTWAGRFKIPECYWPFKLKEFSRR